MTTITSQARVRPRAALAGATILGLPLGSIYAYSVFLSPLEQLLNANRSELASVFGISVIFFTLGMNVVPRLFGRMPVAWIILIAATLASGGVALASFARTFHELAVGYGVLFAFGGGLAYVAAQQSVNASPLTRPGLVNGYLVSLFPLGAMIAAPAFGWGIDRFGVRLTLQCLALVVGLAGIVATALLAHSGVRLGLPGTGSPVTASTARSGTRIVFWQLFFVFLLAATAGLMVLSQAAGMLTAYGATKSAALAATTAITAAIAAARIAGGWLTDRFPIPFVAGAAHAIALAGGIALTLVPTPAMAIPTLGLIGVGYGLVSGVAAGAIAAYWPKALFGQTASRIYIAWCLAALALPIAAARLYDLSGNYKTAIILAAIANLAGLLVGLTLPRRAHNR
ncbi:MAG: hypothetical protein R3D67_06870 [Hyphomicrobiaceae bacterium]